MKAVVCRAYGPPDQLKVEEVATPAADANEALIEVHAASINFGDLAMIKGTPFLIRLMGYGLFKPNVATPGTDIAGQVVAVGKDVSRFKVGDDVLADVGLCGLGAFAEYAAVPESDLVLKPANVSFEQAAAAPQAAVVALQGLRDKGKIQAGQQVLINGASGGIGTFAVQIAKTFGAEVTGVCSGRNLALVRSLGADHVIDYTQEDFTRRKGRYDIILDIVANRSTRSYVRALRPNGRYVAVAFNPSAMFLGGFYTWGSRKKTLALSQMPGVFDLEFIRDLMAEGMLVPVIDKRYPLAEAPQALAYVESGRRHGKVVITMDHAGG